MDLSNEEQKEGNPEMEHEDPAEASDTFQLIMEKAGNHGPFQRYYNLIIIGGLSMAGAMIYMNIILALNVPDHWCTVPGRERTNFTLDEWRGLTLPTRKDNRGSEKFSSCEMYEKNFSSIDDWLQWQKWNASKVSKSIECQHGWSYDRTWYESTIPTQENWVCSKDLFVTNAFVIGRITEVLGCLVLGQMGDIVGRRIIFYISVIACSVGRALSILTTGSYMWFLVFTSVAAFAVNSLFQSPQIVGMEISREQDRSKIVTYQSFGWSIGTTVMPLLYWWLGDWRPFMWATTVPTALVLIFYRFVIESPRWLISKRRFADAIVQFKKIARINGRTFEITEKELTQQYVNVDNESTYGIASLFMGRRMARNTIIMGFSWCVVAVSYFTLVLFSSRMGGNPFLNFLLQSIVEIPAYMVGKYMGDKFGRRITTSFSFLVSFGACIPIIVLATEAKYEPVITGLAVFIKFLNAVTFFTSCLQAMEIYPTCVRQTGLSFGTIIANAVGIVAPYLVYLGTTIDIRAPYYILGIMFLVGGIAALFLPETLHKKLPDSLEEARYFGIHDKFFSLPKALPTPDDTHAAQEQLNQPQYAP